MNTEAFRLQVRELLAQRQPGIGEASTSHPGVRVPLRLSSAGDLGVLSELIQRVAASPALSSACAAGLLRFELSIDAAMTGAGPVGAPAASPKASCCDDCAQGKACRCDDKQVAAEPQAATPLLRGVVTERDVKALPDHCKLVGAAPGAVITPLARDACANAASPCTRARKPES